MYTCTREQCKDPTVFKEMMLAGESDHIEIEIINHNVGQTKVNAKRIRLLESVFEYVINFIHRMQV